MVQEEKKMLRQQRAREEWVIVLDYLHHGYAEDSRPFHMKEPIVQAIGRDHFTLFEIVPNTGILLKASDEIYVGEGKRDKVRYIKGILPAEKLTQTAKTELPFIIEKLVSANEKCFVDFFNNAGAVSLRSHQLELLPGIGRKHTAEVLEERKRKAFTSFADIKKRVPAVPDPKKAIVQRILDELEEKDRFRLFVRV